MLNIAKIKAGQRITLSYASPMTWARKTDNRFLDLEVTRELKVAFTACGQETYQRQADKLGHETSGKAPWFEFRPSLGGATVIHPGKGTVYVAGINHDVKASRILIGGREASAEEQAEMKAFLRESVERERGLGFKVWSLDKLENATLE